MTIPAVLDQVSTVVAGSAPSGAGGTPVWWQITSGVVAIGVALFNVGKAVWDHRQRKAERAADKRSALEDGFWLRQIVVPVCIEPFIGFVVEQSAAFKKATESGKSTDAELRKLLRSYERAAVEVENRLRVLVSADESLYTRAAEILDELTGRVSSAIGLLVMGTKKDRASAENPNFFEAITELWRCLLKYQEQIQTGPKAR